MGVDDPLGKCPRRRLSKRMLTHVGAIRERTTRAHAARKTFMDRGARSRALIGQRTVRVTHPIDNHSDIPRRSPNSEAV